jgi:hypothetical protein
MRQLTIDKSEYTEVFAVDERGPGNANHVYEVKRKIDKIGQTIEVLSTIVFQNGPVKEAGINGIQNEDLLAIVIDRLQGFEKGPYDCVENKRALVDLYGALLHLQKRTKNREARGVEGTSAI